MWLRYDIGAPGRKNQHLIGSGYTVASAIGAEGVELQSNSFGFAILTKIEPRSVRIAISASGWRAATDMFGFDGELVATALCHSPLSSFLMGSLWRSKALKFQLRGDAVRLHRGLCNEPNKLL
jgi:hypothetical protein